MMLIALALVGALTCDANADGRVTIDELVAGVAAAMSSPADPCGCAACDPVACYEFPAAVIDGHRYQCATEVCQGNEVACVRVLLVRGGCTEVPLP